MTLDADALTAIAAALPVTAAAEPVEWLTYEQAGTLLGCTADAVRMRASRGRLEVRHHGRRAYVSRCSVDRLCGMPHNRRDDEMAPARLPPPEARPRKEQLP